MSFSYRGVRCRETISLPGTKANITYAEQLRSAVLHDIAKGTFEYTQHFPDSKQAALFGCANGKVKIKVLVAAYLEQMESVLSHGTHHTYTVDCNNHWIPTFGELPINELTPAKLRKWISGLRLTLKTVSNILIPMRNYHQARHHRWPH